MSSVFSAHRITALVVLIASAAWVLTGEFSAVGSAEAEGAEAAEATPEAEAAPLLRTVAVATPVFADFAREIRISGTAEADKSAVLAARADGIVQALVVKQGQAVEADVLVLQLEGAEVEAQIKTAEAALVQATQQLEVGEELSAKGSLPKLELTSRRADKSAAEAALSQAKATADRLTLHTPFAGTIDTVEIEVGEWVTAGTAIATLLSLDPIVIKAEVSEGDIASVHVGSEAAVRLLDGTELKGTIRHVAKQASQMTRTFAVEVALPNADGTIPAGVTAEVRLLTAPQKAVTVPRSVLTLSDDGGIGVRVVGADNIAQFAPVQIIDDGEAGLVIAGIPENVRIIVAGQDLIRDGDQVIAAELPAGAQP